MMNRLFFLSLFFCAVASYDTDDSKLFPSIQRIRQSSEPHLIGGPSKETPATIGVSSLVTSLEQEIKDKLSETTGSKHITGKVEAISFTQQLVSGINYFVKIRVEVEGKLRIFHVRIYKGFNGIAKLSGVSDFKDENDPIEYIKQN